MKRDIMASTSIHNDEAFRRRHNQIVGVQTKTSDGNFCEKSTFPIENNDFGFEPWV